MPIKPWNASVQTSRRNFLLNSTSLGIAGTLSSTTLAHGNAESKSLFSPGDRILFQGDSITDAKRERAKADIANRQPALGNGYAWIAASQLLVNRSKDRLEFFNRGISGNKVFQLADRWQEDCIELQPQVLSVLIGVNDFWHTLNGRYDGTVEKYEEDYLALLQRSIRTLPKLKIVVCEPFVLKCGVVDEKWIPEFDQYWKAARKVAEKVGAVFVPFQDIFDRAVEFAPPEHWAKDGVHPTNFGTALMAHAWLTAVDAFSMH